MVEEMQHGCLRPNHPNGSIRYFHIKLQGVCGGHSNLRSNPIPSSTSINTFPLAVLRQSFLLFRWGRSSKFLTSLGCGNNLHHQITFPISIPQACPVAMRADALVSACKKDLVIQEMPIISLAIEQCRPHQRLIAGWLLCLNCPLGSIAPNLQAHLAPFHLQQGYYCGNSVSGQHAFHAARH